MPSQAQQYGFAVMIADKSGLVNFKIRTFAGTLEQFGLTDDQWQILRALAAEFALSLPGVSALTARPEAALASDLRHLIDLNLIVVAGNLFAIASPIRAAVQAVKGTLAESDFTTIGSRLKATFWDGITTLPPIEIIEATIHAVLRSANPDLRDFKGFVLPSVLYRAAKEYYDRGGRDAWETAQRYTEQLLQISPEHRQGLILKAKTHVRLSEWAHAGATIETIKRLKLPEYHYLAGFMLWKKREFAKAVSEFQNALRVGQESMEIYHGLAWCYVRLDRLEDAEKTIRRGLRGRRQTSLLLDLAAHIAIIRRNYPEAEEYIDRLQRVRAFDDHAFRLATLWKAKKEFRKALPLLEQAMRGPRLRFEIKATLIDTVVELRDFPRATQLLDELDQHERHGRDQKSVRIGLRCKLNLRNGNWREAERIWQSLEDRNSPVHIALHTEILEKKISDVQTSPGDRAAARETLASLRTDPATAAFFDIETDPEATEDDDEREPT